MSPGINLLAGWKSTRIEKAGDALRAISLDNEARQAYAAQVKADAKVEATRYDDAYVTRQSLPPLPRLPLPKPLIKRTRPMLIPS